MAWSSRTYLNLHFDLSLSQPHQSDYSLQSKLRLEYCRDLRPEISFRALLVLGGMGGGGGGGFGGA